MLPSLLWIAIGLIAAVLTGMRAQLMLLARMPDGGWLAAAGGLLVGGLVLAVALATVFTFRSLKGNLLLLGGVPLLVLIVGGAGIWRFPERHFKDLQTVVEWRQLHPTLRLAVWLVAIEDRSMVLTDIARTPEGYVGMGLEPQRESRHYVGEDGYSRAVDLRVSDAGRLRNWARQGLFLLMGVETVRHVGTADHLHVALPE